MKNSRFVVSAMLFGFLVMGFALPTHAAKAWEMQGNVDVLNCTTVSGWAWDYDAPNSQASVEIKVRNVNGGAVLDKTITTNVYRSDINAQYGVTGNHGFSYSFPSSLNNGSTYSVHVIALKTSGNSDYNNDLTGNGQSIECAKPTPPTPPTVNNTNTTNTNNNANDNDNNNANNNANNNDNNNANNNDNTNNNSNTNKNNNANNNTNNNSLNNNNDISNTNYNNVGADSNSNSNANSNSNSNSKSNSSSDSLSNATSTSSSVSNSTNHNNSSVTFNPTISQTVDGTNLYVSPNFTPTTVVYPYLQNSPECSIQVTPNVLQPGQHATMTWTSFNAFSGTITGFGGVTTNGSVEIAPIQTTTYTGIFTGNNGAQVSCQAIVQVAGTVGPIVYNPVPAVPYVTLSQVPYTGLDLGTWGTAAYWGFLALWCLFIGYLIVVKRLHNELAVHLNALFFSSEGDDETTETTDTETQSEAAIA